MNIKSIAEGNSFKLRTTGWYKEVEVRGGVGETTGRKALVFKNSSLFVGGKH